MAIKIIMIEIVSQKRIIRHSMLFIIISLIMKKIKRKYNNKEITSFNCCYDDYTDIEKCVDFFIENAELFMPMYVVYSYINPYETDYYKSLEKNCKQEKCFNKSYGKVYDKFVNGEYKSAVQKAATQKFILRM